MDTFSMELIQRTENAVGHQAVGSSVVSCNSCTSHRWWRRTESPPTHADFKWLHWDIHHDGEHVWVSVRGDFVWGWQMFGSDCAFCWEVSSCEMLHEPILGCDWKLTSHVLSGFWNVTLWSLLFGMVRSFFCTWAKPKTEKNLTWRATSSVFAQSLAEVVNSISKYVRERESNDSTAF